MVKNLNILEPVIRRPLPGKNISVNRHTNTKRNKQTNKQTNKQNENQPKKIKPSEFQVIMLHLPFIYFLFLFLLSLA
jgi:hypothetical protein